MTRPNRLAAALLAGLGIGFALALLGAEGLDTLAGHLGGDYANYYGAGRLVAEGRGAELYDWSAQRAAQAGLHGGGRDGFLIFAYPPAVAALFAPLSALPFVASYAVYVGLLVAMLAAAVRLMRPLLPRLDGQGPAVLAGLLAVYPLLHSVLGAQNTALTLLLMVVAWRGLATGREGAAGLALGLMLYKPQFGLPLIGLVLLGGHWRVLPGVAAAAALVYGLGAGVAGWDWPTAWWDNAMRLRGVTPGIEAHSSVGLPAVFGIAGWAAAGALGLGLALVWGRRSGDLAWRMALTAPGIVLLAPHALFYDAGLAALAGPVLLDRAGRRAAPAVGLLAVASYTGLGAGWLGVNPLLGVLAATAGVVLWARRFP